MAQVKDGLLKLCLYANDNGKNASTHRLRIHNNGDQTFIDAEGIGENKYCQICIITNELLDH